jgi:hypothetical protein
VRRAQPDAVDAEQSLQRARGLGDLGLDRDRWRCQEGATFPVVIAQERVAVGVLLDVEQRVVDERFERLDIVDEGSPADEERAGHLVLFVVPADHLEGATCGGAVDGLAKAMRAEARQALADRAGFDVVSDQKGCCHREAFLIWNP